jgi:SsrA-binding protein
MRATSTIRLKNKKATFLYEILETCTAGVQLLGTEIKSIRGGKASLTETYCAFMNGELYIRNMYVAEYEMGGYVNHEPRRDRKLLLNRQELNKWNKKMKERGFTIVPLSLFINANGIVKIDIALTRGKKHFDKREDIKAKDNKREMDREHKVR